MGMERHGGRNGLLLEVQQRREDGGDALYAHGLVSFREPGLEVATGNWQVAAARWMLGPGGRPDEVALRCAFACSCAL